MSEEKKIKVVLLEPGKLARTAEIGTSIEDLQNAVDGLIEPFYPFEEQVCIVCNDEGKINGMLPNRSVKNKDGVMVDFIFGPAFICDCRGESFDSLSDEQIARYEDKIGFIECKVPVPVFCRCGKSPETHVITLSRHLSRRDNCQHVMKQA